MEEMKNYNHHDMELTTEFRQFLCILEPKKTKKAS